MTNPCEIWREALANPKKKEATDAAQAHLAELMEHVRECTDCLGVADKYAENAEALFEALGVADNELTEAERNRIDKAWSDNESQIEEAVRNVLLPAVPSGPEVDESVTPLEIFLAINALNLLVFNRFDPKGDLYPVLTGDGLYEQNSLTVPSASLVSQIRRHTPLSEGAALAIYEWSLTAADYVPGLFLEFQATKTAPGLWLQGIALTLDISPVRRRDLNTRWVPRVRSEDFEVARPIDARVSWSRTQS